MACNRGKTSMAANGKIFRSATVFWLITVTLSLFLPLLRAAEARSAAQKRNPAAEPPIDFPYGTATPSEFCGVCHAAVYAEHAYGFGADLKFNPMVLKDSNEPLLSIPEGSADTGTAHHLAGVD